MITPSKLINTWRVLVEAAGNIVPNTADADAMPFLQAEIDRLEALLWAGPTNNRDVLSWRLDYISGIVHACEIDEDAADLIRRVMSDITAILPQPKLREAA